MRSAEMWVPSNPNSPLSSLPPVHVHKSQSGHTDHYKFLGFCRVQVQVVVITPVCEMPDLISVGCFIIVLYHSYYCGTASKFDSVVGSVNEGADIRVDDFHPDILWSNCIKSWAEIHKEYSYMGGGVLVQVSKRCVENCVFCWSVSLKQTVAGQGQQWWQC